VPPIPSVRPAIPADAPAIADLLGQLGYPTSAEAIPTRLAALDAQGGVVFVALTEHARVVGLASGARHAALHADGEVAYITALVADASARRQGVGRTLVLALERRAAAHGCSRLSVTSAEHRADAHAFYPQCGFPYTGRRFTKKL
jgi:GNAT superfamily N-acetyltransferase